MDLLHGYTLIFYTATGYSYTAVYGAIPQLHVTAEWVIPCQIASNALHFTPTTPSDFDVDNIKKKKILFFV